MALHTIAIGLGIWTAVGVAFALYLNVRTQEEQYSSIDRYLEKRLEKENR